MHSVCARNQKSRIASLEALRQVARKGAIQINRDLRRLVSSVYGICVSIRIKWFQSGQLNFDIGSNKNNRNLLQWIRSQSIDDPWKRFSAHKCIQIHINVSKIRITITIILFFNTLIMFPKTLTYFYFYINFYESELHLLYFLYFIPNQCVFILIHKIHTILGINA